MKKSKLKAMIESLEKTISDRNLVKEYEKGFIDGMRYALHVLKEIEEAEE